MEGSNSLKSVQLALVVFITQTGVGIIMIPSALSKVVGHDGWISVLITGVAVTILGMLIILLLRRYKDKAIYDINQLIFGKFIGFCLNAFLIFYLLMATVSGASLFNYFIRINLLQETPPWALAPFIVLPSLYLVWQGLKPVSRFLFCSIISYFVIFLFIVLLYKAFRISFLMPLGEAGISRILYSTKTSFFAFMGFELIAFLYPYISDRNKTLKWYSAANLASTFFFLVVVLVSTVVFGENFLPTISMPYFYLSRIYNAPILERVDLYLITLWFIPTACSMRSYIFSCFDGLQKVFKLKKTRTTYTLFFIGIFTLSGIPKDFNQVLLLTKMTNILGMGVVMFLVLCLFISFIRKRGVSIK